MQQQTDISYQELEEYVSRATLPVSHHVRWTHITLNKQDMTTRSYGIFDGLQINQSVRIGTSVPPVQYVLPWLSGLQTSFIAGTPSLTEDAILTLGVDYVITKDSIIFFENPFERLPLAAGANDNGDPMVTLDCWGYCSDEDVASVRNFFGTYVGINTRSSDLFKQLTNSIWDLYTTGATNAAINNFLLTLTDCDVVTAKGVITDIFTEAGRLWVETDTGLYSAPDSYNAIVSVGDTIDVGQNLFDAYRIYEGRDQIPDTVVASFTAESGYLGGGYISGLSFDNKQVPLTFAYAAADPSVEVLTDINGSYLITDKNGVDYVLTGPSSYYNSGLKEQGIVPIPIFDIGGFPEDVAKLRQNMAHGIWVTQTDVIQELTRGQQAPYTINPFEYIQKAALRNNILFIDMRAEAIVDTKAVMSALRYLSNTIPAGTSFMVYIQRNMPQDSIDLTSTVAETVTGYIVADLSDEHIETNTVDTIHINRKVG
jgi:hypothetical protein